MTTNISGAVAADGNVLVLAGPIATFTDITAVTAVQLNSTAVKDITYDLTAAGLTFSAAEDSVPNDRFTAKQAFSAPGRETVTASLQYVFGATDDVADGLFVEKAKYVLAVRYAVDHDQAVAAGDKFHFLQVQAGIPNVDQPAANTNLSKTLPLFPIGVMRRNQAIT